MDSNKAVLGYKFVYCCEVWVVPIFEYNCSFPNPVFLVDLISWFIETKLPWSSCLHYSCVCLSLLEDWAYCKTTWSLRFLTVSLLSNNYDFNNEDCQFFNIVSVKKQKLLISSLHHTLVRCRGNKWLKLGWISPAIKASCFVHLTIVKCSIVLDKVLGLCGHCLGVIFETDILQRQFLYTLKANHVSSRRFILLVVRKIAFTRWIFWSLSNLFVLNEAFTWA
jgi:hypothetical protein